MSTFRVESDWHLSAKFPPKNPRINYFPFVAELQIPNFFKDEAFPIDIPNKFPNITKCWINLPTVKFLRSCFKTMANSKLISLILSTQFYFESTLEFCLFGERGTQVPAIIRQEEKEKWKQVHNLKSERYEHLVDNSCVEAPCWENIVELTNDEKYAGLCALKNLKMLEIKHVPNRVSIPKRDTIAFQPETEFCNNCIGFQNYPLSKSFIKQLPAWVNYSEWSNFELKEEAPSKNDA